MQTQIDSSKPRGRRPPSHRETLLVGVFLLLFIGLFGLQSWHSSKQDQILQLRTVAELVEKATDRYFEQLQLALRELARDLVDEGGLDDLSLAQRRLARFKEERGELLSVNLLGLNGRFLATSATTRLSELPTVGDQRDFAEVVASQRQDRPMEVTRPLLGPVAKRWVLPIRYALRNRQGELAGFIVASASVQMLQTFWSQAPVVSRASIGLIRDDGYLISRFPNPPEAQEADVYGKPRTGAVVRFLREHGHPADGYVEGANNLAGKPYGNVFVRLEHHPLTLVVGMPMSEFTAAWWSRTQVAFVLALACAAAAVCSVHLLRRREQTWAANQLLIEGELRASELFLERTGQVAGVGGWSLDLESGNLTWTRQTYRIHEVDDGFKPTVETAISFYDAAARPAIQAAVDEGIRTGKGWDLELELITATGRKRWVRAQGQAESESGKVVRLVGAFQDITDSHQRHLELLHEQALREQAERHAGELDKLLRERGTMLDVLAHEVRQPLNSASAALQAAQASVDPTTSGGPPSEGLRRAQLVLNEVLSSIDNTLAVAALLANPKSVRREDCDIDLLVRLAIGDLPAAEQTRVQIERATATRTAAMDLGLMRLALRNLLANAIRYSPLESPVVVRIADSDVPLALLVEVSDQGPGIDDQLKAKLFSRGTRGQHGADKPGHGLGLYIVSRVMQLHGGAVEVVGREDCGLTMRLVITQNDEP